MLRYITVFKKEKSTIVARDAALDLSDESRRLVTSLLSRCPVRSLSVSSHVTTDNVQVTPRDKLESVSGPDPRAGRATLGRLGGGVAQVPGPASSTEFLASRRELPIWSHRQQLVRDLLSPEGSDYNKSCSG